MAVVAHPKREAMANDLARRAAADVICWDVSHIGAERNHLQAWRWLAELPTEWGVVLEDDVIVCDHFTRELTAALHNAPTSVVSLYLPRGRPRHWQESIAKGIAPAVMSGAQWLTAPALFSAQGYAIRTEFLRQHLQVMRRVYKGLPIDEAITSWVNHHKCLRDVSYALPSLVDHRDGPTLVNHRDGPVPTTTELMTWDSDPTGVALPNVRKSWLFGAHENWTSTSLALEIPLVLTEGDNRDNEARGPNERGPVQPAY